ncbi:MAG: DUF998 domain-containing protein [Bacteroidota bacterium]
MFRKFLLSCGILSSLLYIAMNIFVPFYFKGYDWISQSVSELSAIEAPTRSLWVGLAMTYVLLFALFGWGVIRSFADNWLLNVMGWLILLYTVLNFFWPPMHLRGQERTLTDTLHIVWTIFTILLFMLIMGFGAVALGTAFRAYTISTFVIFIVFGLLSAVQAPAVSQNLPTPLLGIWERINIGAFMLWVIVLSVVLLRRLIHSNIANRGNEGDNLFNVV